jgi:NADPH:quinone reductase-like Zn-dependent oxidoreductase
MTVMAAQLARQSLLPETMIAARVHQFGAPGTIALESMRVPVPDDHEVLVQVKAAGVGPWDGWIRAGKSVLPQPLPLTLGSDLSGIVAAIGRGVTEFAVGDPVFGVTNPRFTGAYAEYALAAEGMIARRPSSLGDVDAASMPVIAVTAWQALFDEARLSSSAKVLIHGGAGNVGRYAVQFARAAGLHTVATAKAQDVADVRSLGADLVVDVQAEQFEEKVESVDAVIDLVGGEVLARSYTVLKPGGILVSAVAAPDQELARRHGVAAHFFLVKVTRDHLARIGAMVDAGELRTKVGVVLPLGAVHEAHEMLEGLRPRPSGKIVLRID